MSTPNSPGQSFSPIQARSRLRTVFLVLLACVAVSALAGALFELLATRRIAANNAPAGRLIDIRGRKNHIFCVGSGSPTIILISGLGETYDSWSKVQPRLAQSARTCSYDRAGLGWSDRPQESRDVLRMSTELHDLLAASELNPPYLLVGHSLGGGIARVFAGQNPQEVAAMVFVDAVPAGFLSRLQPDAWDANMSRTAHRMKWMAPFGIARLQGKCQVDNRPFIHCSDFWATFTAEREALPTSVRQIASVQSIGDTPLRILSRDTDPAVGWGSPQNRLAWEAMQEDLAKLSTRSRQTVVKGATHYIQDDQPDVVIEAISDMLMSLRNQPK